MITIETEKEVAEQSFGGLSFDDGVWELDLEYYSSFIFEVTGVSVSKDMDYRDCYEAGNRLESFIQSKKRVDRWDAEIVDGYSDVTSLEEVYSVPHKSISENQS